MRAVSSITPLLSAADTHFAEESGLARPNTSNDALAFLATVLSAKAVVEIGTGTGQSGLSLIRGMRPEGVLTSIDIDPVAQKAARKTFGEAGVASARTRLIAGVASQVMGRLTDGAYDLIYAATGIIEFPTYLERGLRLLRPGGAIVFDGVDSALSHDERAAVTQLEDTIAERGELVPLRLPVAGGLLAVAQA